MRKITCYIAMLVFLLTFSAVSFADSVTLPDSLTAIEEEAFYGDTDIAEVTVPEGTKTIGARAFANSGLQIIHLPASVTGIDPTAFDGLSANFTISAPWGSESYFYAVKNHYKWQSTPDSNFNDFMGWMLQKNDSNEDGIFEADEISAVSVISCSGQGFTSLDGVEAFYNLTALRCDSNKLTSLDVSNCNALKFVWCYSNQLTSLDFSQCPDLIYLACYFNQLTSLDVSNCTALASITCCDNKLTDLDFSDCCELARLDCYYNQLTSLNVDNCAALADLRCYNNKLTTLDVSDCTALTSLYCYENQLENMDLSSNPSLSMLDCRVNNITTLDVSHCASNIEVKADDNVTITR